MASPRLRGDVELQRLAIVRHQHQDDARGRRRRRGHLAALRVACCCATRARAAKKKRAVLKAWLIHVCCVMCDDGEHQIVCCVCGVGSGGCVPVCMQHSGASAGLSSGLRSSGDALQHTPRRTRRRTLVEKPRRALCCSFRTSDRSRPTATAQVHRLIILPSERARAHRQPWPTSVSLDEVCRALCIGRSGSALCSPVFPATPAPSACPAP